MAAQLIEKDNVIKTLLQNVNQLETKIDHHEQYSRRANIRIHGVQEDVRGENVEAKVLNIINEKMGFLPPIKCENIERCHRLGRQVDGQRQPRAVIVRFNSERLRDAVFRARGSLKDFNNTQERATRIFLNEDLTAKRASLALKTR